MKNIFLAFSMIAVATICSCHTSKKMQQTTSGDSISRKWMLKTIDSVDAALVLKSKAFIDLTNDSVAHAKAGCNSLNFGVQLLGNNQIHFKQGPATLMFCQEFMSAENGLVATLKKVKTYSIEAHKISLKDSTGKVLITGVAEDWD